MSYSLIACDCGRGDYDPDKYSSCYDCFLDRQAAYVTCLYCGHWHSAEFDTCFQCRPQGRDEAARDLKLVILARDSYTCRYCGVADGAPKIDPRLIRGACPPACSLQHNHRRPCKPKCSKRHRHRGEDDPGTCQPGCTRVHDHVIRPDDGLRVAKMHVDHVMPCRWGGTADQWNLQSLCQVCNIAKGSDWVAGSRHDKARQVVMASYATYLYDYLSADEKHGLERELATYKLDRARCRQIVLADYRDRVRAARAASPLAV